MASPEPVIVFFGYVMMHIDEDQAQALLMRGQIIKCPDPSQVEHYHLTRSAIARSIRGEPIDLRPAIDAAPGATDEVAAMISRCTNQGGYP